MNYLVVEGHQQAAACFHKEAHISRIASSLVCAQLRIYITIYIVNLTAGVDLNSISDRMEMRAALQRGDVQAAIKRANELHPQVMG